MGADIWLDCLVCKEKQSVGMYNTGDFELLESGSIDASCIHGQCRKCKKSFKVNREEGML
jgi:hypothetical protein